MKASLLLGRVGLSIGLAAAGALYSPRAFAEVVAIAGSDGTASPAWTDIEADTYEQRAHFTAGADRLSARLDDQIRILKAKRAGMTQDVKDWDLAYKEVDDSRQLLTSRITEIKKVTTLEAWADAKDKVGEAWKRSQLAVDKMNATVTS
jgi:hypothetical protein